VHESLPVPPTPILVVFRLAALFTFLAVAMGAMVCATGSGASCPTWPGCFPDQIAPEWQVSPVIEFTHRVVAVTAGPLVLAAALLSLRLKGSLTLVRILPWVALIGAVAAGAFGRRVVLNGLPTWLGALDLFCALTSMTSMAVSTVLIRPRPAGVTPLPAPEPGTGQVARLSALSVAVLILMHVAGIFAAGHLSFTRCMGWPMWQIIDTDLHPWLQAVRLGMAVLGAALVIATAVRAARTASLRRWGIAIALLFAAEMILGLWIRTGQLTSAVAAIYSVLAVALLWSLGLLAAFSWRARLAPEGAPLAPASPPLENVR
jgi:cytochrome c oxidase assembly protein subunit 15